MRTQKGDEALEQLVRSRLRDSAGMISRSLRQIEAGNPLGAEPRAERRVRRIAAKTNLTTRDAEAVARAVEAAARRIDAGDVSGGPEAQQGPTIDYVGVEFLTRGRQAANAVGRIVLKGGRNQGTGFLVGSGVLLTNNHVIADAEDAGRMLVEFDYELDDAGSELSATVFALDPARCFVSAPMQGLDYSLVAVGERMKGGKAIAAFGYLPLSDASDKHMLGELANIIQHPLGDRKQVVVRENNLVSRDETARVLHYLADTEPGSSGSPVCNNDWQPIALHHWGGPSLEVADRDGRPLRKDINEGVRISAIVEDLKARLPALGTPSSQVVADLLALWDGRVRPELRREAQPPVPVAIDRIASPLRFPFEVVLRPLADGPSTASSAAARPTAAPAAERADTAFADRGGYEPGFIPGFVLPLPDASRTGYRLARNQGAAAGDDPHELRYHHFSILMNAERRIAAVTACNIDGSRLVAVNREDKSVITNPTLADLGAEGSDDFQPDPRVLDSEQMGRAFYQGQKVPGFELPPFPDETASEAVRSRYYRILAGRTARMLQKGHIVLRGDPAWGVEAEALAAEADTFFYTNAAPQFGFFNQGSPVDRPGAKGTLRWRALETYVLRNAFVMRQRVTVFAGPVFDGDYDPSYREGVAIPMRFWKIAVWSEGGELHAIALLADQKPVLEMLTQGMPEGAEAYQDNEELARVSEFLVTVAEIEARTGLNFGKAVRDADVRAGVSGNQPAVDIAPDGLRRGTRRRRRR